MTLQATLPAAVDGYLCNTTVGQTLSIGVSGYLCLLVIIEEIIDPGGGGGGASASTRKRYPRPRYHGEEVYRGGKLHSDEEEENELLQLLILATIYGMME